MNQGFPCFVLRRTMVHCTLKSDAGGSNHTTPRRVSGSMERQVRKGRVRPKLSVGSRYADSVCVCVCTRVCASRQYAKMLSLEAKGARGGAATASQR